jgi:peptidoglycan-N-acetylglucosamine deacetylase
LNRPVERGSRWRRQVALTFDDGPDEATPEILDLLRGHGARATFFVRGEQIAGREDVLKRTAAEGHELGNHSWSHPDLRDEPWRAATELERTSGAIVEVVGRRPELFRPPNGHWTTAVVREAAGRAMRTILWDVNPEDWAGAGTSAEEIERLILAATRRGSIVLLHDGGDRASREPLLTALPHVLEALAGRGFAFVGVTELLR